jgi:glycosyltransferase involved in cell wall biosynthesis
MKRAIVVAYDLNPKMGSESAKANLWVAAISRHFDVDVFVCDKHRKSIPVSDYPRARFHFVVINRTVRRRLEKLRAFPLANWMFVSAVKKELEGQDLHDWALIQVLTPAGVHSFNDLYTLGIPVLVGPLGGALPTHPGFRDVFKDEWLRNALRGLFYRLVVSVPWWREYYVNAEMVLVGTGSVIDVLPPECRSRARIIFDTCVDTEFFRPTAQERPAASRVRILFVGSLSANKGAVLLIEAVKLCRARGLRGIEVAIVGGGPLRSRLDELISEYDLGDCVTLKGHVPRREIVNEYQQSDIFCLPTLREPGGGAILEAMACGLPVVTSNYGGPGHSVTDDCGIKIEMVDSGQYVRDLSFALERLVRDEALRRSMGDQARQRALMEFSAEALDAKIQDVYRQFIP